MQSLYRALRRGNAVAYFVSQLQGVKILYKKGSKVREWCYALQHNVTPAFLAKYAQNN